MYRKGKKNNSETTNEQKNKKKNGKINKQIGINGWFEGVVEKWNDMNE